MANMDVQPQVPVKLIRKYLLTYSLKNGDVQQVAPSVTQEGVIDAALALINASIAPSSTVSGIHIAIGNNSNTA